MNPSKNVTWKGLQKKRSAVKRKVSEKGQQIGSSSHAAAEDMNRTGTNDDGKAVKGRARSAGEKGKGHCVEQPLIVSDDEGNEPMAISDDEGSEPLAIATKMEKLSLAIKEGGTVMCMWRDGVYHPAKVLGKKEQPDGCLKYYVHYPEFNRRNDRWVELKELNVTVTEPSVADKADTQTGVMTRRQKRLMGKTEEHEELDPETLRVHEELTKIKTIDHIQLGKYLIDTWYHSPFPSEYKHCNELFFCEFCLTFLKRKHQLQRHSRKGCSQWFPPGQQIYSSPSQSLSVFQVDGSKHRVYAENLCYLAKMFMDHKLMFNDLREFFFYILCEEDVLGHHMVAYFSKEKSSEEGNNLACILTFPPFQRRGYGSFLIEFSYELSKREGKIGRPEHPLSDLGAIGYKKYWTEVLLEILSKKRKISIEELSKLTAIAPVDIVAALKDLDLIIYRNGENIISAKHNRIQSHLASLKKSVLRVETENLQWVPPEEKSNPKGKKPQ